MTRRTSIKVRINPKGGIIAKLEELRKNGYKFEVIHSRGGDVFDLKVSYDSQEARPIFEVSGIILAPSDM